MNWEFTPYNYAHEKRYGLHMLWYRVLVIVRLCIGSD